MTVFTVRPVSHRFDNLSTAELARRHTEALAEHVEIRDALWKRLVDECPIEVGKAYRIKAGRFAGRKMLVNSVGAVFPSVMGTRSSPSTGEAFARAEGRLDGKSKAGDGWTLRHQVVRADQLEPL